ncbi:MAG: hypothetical protein R3234_08455, partial [Thermoanaerobaculia bacterium]|nr:hypothetical protein [Thermoanaerobaculia bacterium]
MRKILLGALAVGLLGPVASQAGDLEVDEDLRAGGQLISTATSGPPLAVSSTDWVEGLDADRLDGFQASDFA